MVTELEIIKESWQKEKELLDQIHIFRIFLIRKSLEVEFSEFERGYKQNGK